MRRFSKSRRPLAVIVTTLLLGAVGLTVYQTCRIAEPVYEGRTLEAWLDRCRYGGGGALPPFDLGEIYKAVRTLSPVGVPCLISRLKSPETIVANAYAKFHGVMPVAAQELLPPPVNRMARIQRRLLAAQFLQYSGTNGIAAIPALLEALNDPDFKNSREVVVSTLGILAPESPYESKVLSMLLDSITNDSKMVRSAAFLSLGNFHQRVPVVLPPLMKSLEYYETQGAAMEGLVRLGTNAVAALEVALEHESGYPKAAQVVLDRITALQRDKSN